MVVEIINTRRLAAPRERVFAAFADPQQLAQWWGPAGFSSTLGPFELRAGGVWQVQMRGPDGATFHNTFRFTTVEPPARVSYEHEQPGHRFTMSMRWTAPSPDLTELTWCMQLEPTEQHEALRDFLHRGNEENFDRLSTFLHAPASRAS